MTPMQKLKNQMDTFKALVKPIFTEVTLNKSSPKESVTRFCGEREEHFDKGVKSDFIKLYKIKQNIIDDLSANKDVREIILGQTPQKNHHPKVANILQTFSWNDPDRTIENPRNSYHALWQELDDWAKSEKLSVKWDYQHDGGGVHSWYTLTVKPLHMILKRKIK